jgi:hypothetical protein
MDVDEGGVVGDVALHEAEEYRFGVADIHDLEAPAPQVP